MLVEVYRARQNRRIKKAEEKLAKRIFDDISHADVALPPEIQEKYRRYIREASASIKTGAPKVAATAERIPPRR